MTRGLGGHDGYPSFLSARANAFRFATRSDNGDSPGEGRSFSGAAVLARLLEGTEQPGALSRALESHADLRGALAALPAAERQALERRLGPAALSELLALAGESDARLFFESLLQFGARQEAANRLDLATVIYGLVQSQAEGPLGQRAGQRLDAVLGRGAGGARTEFLLRRLAHEASEPTALFAMGAAGTAFRLTRLATLSRLAATPAGNFLTRGFGARAAASLTGFAVEATVFPLAGRAANEALGRSQDWSAQALRRDIASSFLVLGGLKLSGWAAGAAFNRLHGINPLTGQAQRLTGFAGFSQRVIPQAGMLGGILLGHGLEERLGLREHVDGATTMVDSLAMLLQFNVAGRLTHRAFGSRFHAWEQGLDRQTELLARQNVGTNSGRGSRLADLIRMTGPRPQLVTPEGVRMSALGEAGPGRLFEPQSQMTATGEGGGNRRTPPSEPPRGSGPGGDGGGRRVPPDRLAEARRQLDIFREHRDVNAPDSIAAFAGALRFLRENPEAGREALIGRSDLSAAHLDELFLAMAPRDHRVLTNPNLQRVLIPNRGEIALRLARGLRAEGLTPVVLVAQTEANAVWAADIARMGGEVRVIAGATPAEAYQNAYLNIPRILREAQEAGVQAVHPGYGYRSESPEFARALEDAGIVLMGPSVRSMERAGDKDIAKQAFIEAGVPVVPGTRRGYLEVEGLIAELRELGMIRGEELAFPIRLKAVAGGGGRGQRTVRGLQELRDIFPRLSAEALAGFGNGSIMAERFIERFHHVEFQVMADRFGNIIHLGERECTLQERNQKLIEIHPAAIFERFPGLRERMAEASLNAARAMNYTGHGTVEFMVDPVTGDFFAMEVNARIQVEHRVSEAVTGFDLIREAVRVARGLPLSVGQEQVQTRGAAVEVRIKAVDPSRRDRDGNASPAPGLVEEFSVMGSSDFESLTREGVFVETSVRAGDRVSPNADPMIAKIIVTAESRRAAIERAAEVLARTNLRGSQGFASDLSRQLSLLRTRAAQEATYDNRFVDEWTRLGGENFSVHPHRESVLWTGSGPATHFEVGGAEPVSRELADRQAAAFQRLLNAGEPPAESPLQGPVAELLRQSPDLRAELTSEGGRRGLWAQGDASSELRQVALFDNHRPRRLLLSRRVLMPTGERQQVSVEQPIVYDIRFNAEGNAVERVDLYHRRKSGLDLLLSVGPGDPYFRAVTEGGQYRLFAQERATTPATVDLRLIPAGAHRGVEIRDRAGNILVSLAPERVMESPAQRLLSLFEFTGDSVPAHIRQRSETQIRELMAGMARTAPGSRSCEEFLDALGSTPVSLVRRLLALAGENRGPEERQLIDEAIARREISGFWQRHRFESYRPLDENTSLVRFTETSADGTGFPRLMIRVHGDTGLPMEALVPRALEQLDQARREHPQARDHVIQIIDRNFHPSRLPEIQEALNLAAGVRTMLRAASGEGDIGLKRLTLVVDRPGEYPDYFTFRRAENGEGQRTGRYEEDTRYRNLHPMLAHFLELRRLDNFDLERDLAHSDRFTHVYFGRNRATETLEAGADQRLFGLGIVPEAEVQRNYAGELTEIPRVEQEFLAVVRAMHQSLETRTGRRPNWNRMFLNVQPILAVSDAEVAAYAERLAVRHQDQLRGLGLEKVVVKARLRDLEAPDGLRTILVRITNPTGFRFEPMIHNVVRARVAEADGSVALREVLVRNGTYENWRRAVTAGDAGYVIPGGEWAPADIPIRSATPAEIREQQARSRGAVWAYRIPELMTELAERFRVQNGLGQPRLPGSERPEAPYASNFVELDLDPTTVRSDPRTGMIDYNQGRLAPAVDAEGLPRPAGQNQAGVVVGLQTDHLGIGMPATRVVIMGDLTHASRGSLSANECARINAAIRYAAERGIPVDWFTASSGAEIHERRGVEGLDATAATVREIVQNAHSLGVPINIVVDDVNIGAQSYWNSLAAIIHDTGGVLIMTPRGSMALTGPDAWTAAMRRETHSEDLPGEARRYYPDGLKSLAGYEQIHGPNGEAMAFAPNLAAATEMLLRHHYFSYTGRGEIVRERAFGGQDPFERDITVEPAANGRSVGEEIGRILTGQAGNREAILEALRDRGSPPPLRWWADAQGIRYQPGGNGLMPQRFGSLIQEMQIGGRPTMVIFPPVGPLTPADSEIIGRALFKANGRMPVLIIGSLTGFNGDPRSMENRQLFGGATIAEAVVRHRGPITVVDMGYIVGGTFVVVSKQLNPHLRLLALEGSHAQVIGGTSAAKVVFRSRIRRNADRDPRVVAAREAVERASAADRLAREADLLSVRRAVISELEQREGAAFDQVHSVQRAQSVGAVDEVVAPAQLREAIIRHQREALDQYRLDAEREVDAARAEGLRDVLQLPESRALSMFLESLTQVYGETTAREMARTWSEGLRVFSERPKGEPEGGASNGGEGGPGGGSAPP